MIKDRKEAARRKLLRILPRATLEDMVTKQRAGILTHSKLVDAALLEWDLHEVHEASDISLRILSAPRSAFALALLC